MQLTELPSLTLAQSRLCFSIIKECLVCKRSQKRSMPGEGGVGLWHVECVLTYCLEYMHCISALCVQFIV